MDSPKLILLIGAPRSGTTWLQAILSGHPAIVSPQETDLFSRFIGPLGESWDWQVRGTAEDWQRRRFKGLPSVLTETQFNAIVARVIEEVILHTCALKPGASAVLEKSPAHSLAISPVLRFTPNTTFVHLLRDGRDVACSLVAAGQSWGAGWAPTNVGEAAAMWATHVRGAQTAARASGGYIEVRYEALRRDGVNELRRVFSGIGCEIEVAHVTELLNTHAIQRGETQLSRRDALPISGHFAAYAGRPEPKGFVGEAKTGSWAAWSAAERLAFHHAAGDLLVQLGYESDRSWVKANLVLRIRVAARGIVARALRSMASRANRLARRVAPVAKP